MNKKNVIITGIVFGLINFFIKIGMLLGDGITRITLVLSLAFMSLISGFIIGVIISFAYYYLKDKKVALSWKAMNIKFKWLIIGVIFAIINSITAGIPGIAILIILLKYLNIVLPVNLGEGSWGWMIIFGDIFFIASGYFIGWLIERMLKNKKSKDPASI